MSTGIDMNKVTRRVAQSFVQDGLLEIALGWGLVMLSGIIATKPLGMLSIYIVIGFMVFGFSLPAFRKLLVSRRAGYVASANPFVAGGKKDALAILGAVVVLLLAPMAYTFARQGVSIGLGIWMEQYLPVGMGLLLALVFGSLARRWQVVRFYVFALVSTVGGIAGWLIGPQPNIIPIEVQLLSTAAVVEASGVIVLIRFLRNNPVLEEDGADDQG